MNGLMMDYQLTIDRVLAHAESIYPEKTITTMLPDGAQHQYRFREMAQRVRRLSQALVRLGVQPGDRVGTFAWNNYQHLELYYGIPGAGAVCHTLNIRLSPENLSYVIDHAEDKLIFADASLLPLLEPIAHRLETVQAYVLLNAPAGLKTTLPEVHYYEDLLAASDGDFDWRSTDEQMAMGLCYTSGTTGRPKGALYSHRSMVLHTLGSNQATALAIAERDVVLPVVPQFHAMAWGLPYSCMLAGANLVMPGPHLRPAPLADLIAEHRVTVAAGVPSIWTGLYHELKANPRDVSSIRALVVGGAAMPRALIEAYEKELGVSVLHAWGMTEMSPLGTVSRLQSQHEGASDAQKWDVKARQGYPAAGVEMRIVDAEEKILPWDGASMGELQVRGPWVVRQYYQRESTPEHFTADGWFRTGDVCTISPDGYMMITDRTKDLVKSGGEWISSVELENALMAHPQVFEAAVIAIPDDKWTERPLAAVVLAPGAPPLAPAELRQFIAPQFAKFWLPDEFVYVDELPKTSVGKFDKRLLRQQYAAGELGRANA